MASPTYHITSPTTASALGLSGALSGVSFFIEADLTIDVASLDFNNCLFKVKDGVKISFFNLTLFKKPFSI